MQQGLSQRQLADAIGVTQGCIEHIESGKSRVPRVDTAMKIAKVLNVEPEELMRNLMAELKERENNHD